MSYNDISALLNGIEQKTICFADVLEFIQSRYHYTPTAFVNGLIHNQAGENEGSCQVFAFAKLHKLTHLDTLKLFAEHFDNVKNNPKGNDHANIRNFMFYGWQGFFMQDDCLTIKN